MTDRTILRLKNITKLYPGVVALNDVSLDFREGEVHAVVGENGAGKSTMIKAISGALQPTQGSIEIDGKSYDYMTPSLSRQNGIAVIYQEFMLIPVLSAAENIFLGEYPMKGAVIDRRLMEERSAELFRRLKVKIDPKTILADLTTGYQQIVEIAKAVSKNARILIMDEPSAPLTTSEVEAMFAIVDTLKSQGVTIIYISHRMDEIFRLADRVSVMRDGRYIDTLNTKDTNRQELIRLMVGRELTETYPQRAEKATETVLSVRGLTGNGVRDISFDARKGEILGFAGLIGAGRTEMAQLLFGYEKIEDGEILLGGKTIAPKTPADAIGQGIALVPEDRKRQGLVLEMDIRENTTLPSLRRISRMSAIDARQEAQITEKYMKSLRTKAPSQKQKAKNLSGGNQQKVVLAKWLAMDPQVLIFDEPTRGIDVGAKHEIYMIMNTLAGEGKTILMISSDMEELIGMSDRVAVLCRGRMAGILEGDEISQENILAKSAGSDIDDRQEAFH